MTAYYNEFDPQAAQWLRNLIAAGLIPVGDVDERSIEDVTPSDLRGYVQCHFFAGIGGWPLALALAGWPSDRPVWTGSCPCQPFSAAGKSAGFADERHLWPAWQHLIAQCRPPVIFGEQVASKAVDPWIDLVHADMEGMGYAFGCVPFPAASVGAPHIRDRTYWVADVCGEGLAQRIGDGRVQREALGASTQEAAVGRGDAGGVADADGRHTGAEREQRRGEQRQQPQDGGAVRMADADRGQLDGLAIVRRTERDGQDAGRAEGGRELEPRRHADRPGPTNGQWADADWLGCTDGKWRPVEPGAQQMVDGVSRGVVLLRSEPRTKEEIGHATEAVGLAGQVLRALRCGHAAEAVWGSLGGCVGLSEATLLLAVLCEQSRELGQFFNRATQGCAPGSEGIVRAVRPSASEIACAPPGRGCAEQLAWELGDALPKLSQACPSARPHLDHLRQFSGSPIASGVPSRVVRLRAYGNAIVPAQAAEFIRAYAEARGLMLSSLEAAA